MPAISKRRRQLQEARSGQQRIKEKKQDEQLEGAVHEQIDDSDESALSRVRGSIASFSSSNSSGAIASDICAQIANIISTLSDRSYQQL